MYPRRLPLAILVLLWLGLWSGAGSIIPIGSGIADPALTTTPRADSPNVVTVTMRTPRAGFNRLLVSVTVCQPGTERCARIDDVMLDTGSTGLRLEAFAVPGWLRLPPFLGPDRRPLAECLRFVHDDAWGPLFRADLTIGGMTALDLPLQIIGDTTWPQPDLCPRSDVMPTSNGTFGIGPLRSDCLGECVQSQTRPLVFTCAAGGCSPVRGRVAPPYRLPNPVALFPVHNNGVVFDMPSAPPGGAGAIEGRLTFGVGTGGDNNLDRAQILRLGAWGQFKTFYGGAVYPESTIDSGTETYVFADTALPVCNGAFCPRPDRSLGAVVVGQDGASISLAFRVGDYRRIRERGLGASDALAVPAEVGSRSFVWGAPMFLGKRIFVVMDGASVPGAEGATGPFYAIGPNTPR